MLPDSLPIPTSLGEITPAWLAAALRAGGVLERGTVATIDAAVIGEERGFTGIVARLQVTYADLAGARPPASLIAKLPTAERAVPSSYRTRQRDPLAARQYAERCAGEVRFYQEIAPAGAVPAPACLYGAADAAAGRVVLLLEDLAPARPGDVLTGCSPEEVAFVLDAIAPFHARWWAAPALAGLTWLPRWSGDLQARQDRYCQQVPVFLARYGDQLLPPIAEIVRRLQDRYAAVLAALAQAPPTVIHADLHLDNIMFNPPGYQPAAVALDWQSVARGPAIADVAPFIYGSLPVSRQAAAGSLLRHYHHLLLAYGVSDISLEQLHAGCRLALPQQLASIVGWLAQEDPERLTGRERALINAVIGDGRLIAALLATDALGALRD